MALSQSLLLLPPVPEPGTYPSVKAAYHAPLVIALRSLKESVPGRSILDIALPCPLLWTQAAYPRSTSYHAIQQVVANVYKLICIIAAKQGIEVADVDGESIDVRIILLSYPRDGDLKNTTSLVTGNNVGPVIELNTLARSGRPWATIFSVETEPGEVLLKNFKSLSKDKAYKLTKVRGGVTQVTISATDVPTAQSSRCTSVAVGGTFDHLHIGHKLLLTMTVFTLDEPAPNGLMKSKKVITIGMTAADLLAKKKYADLLQSWKTRTDRTHAFIQGILNFSPDPSVIESSSEVHLEGPNGHAYIVKLPWVSSTLELRYVEIWDPFGPTITDPDIDSIVVSGETRSGGKMVNLKRVEVGMTELNIFEVDVLDTDEEETDEKKSKALEGAFQAKLSSTEIRKTQAERLINRSKV